VETEHFSIETEKTWQYDNLISAWPGEILVFIVDTQRVLFESFIMQLMASYDSDVWSIES